MDLVHETITTTLESFLMAHDKTYRKDGRYRAAVENTRGRLSSSSPPGDSRCLICGHIFYDEFTQRCHRCGGLCRFCPSDELALSMRHPNNSDGW
jgi:hypothetical protein